MCLRGGKGGRLRLRIWDKNGVSKYIGLLLLDLLYRRVRGYGMKLCEVNTSFSIKTNV